MVLFNAVVLKAKAMILRNLVSGPQMSLFDGHIVSFSGGFCQTSFALKTTVLISIVSILHCV